MSTERVAIACTWARGDSPPQLILLHHLLSHLELQVPTNSCSWKAGSLIGTNLSRHLCLCYQIQCSLHMLSDRSTKLAPSAYLKAQCPCLQEIKVARQPLGTTGVEIIRYPEDSLLTRSRQRLLQEGHLYRSFPQHRIRIFIKDFVSSLNYLLFLLRISLTLKLIVSSIFCIVCKIL